MWILVGDSAISVHTALALAFASLTCEHKDEVKEYRNPTHTITRGDQHLTTQHT